MDPGPCADFKTWQRRSEGVDEILSHDHMFGRDDVDAMRKRKTFQIGIDERDDTANLGDAKPNGHVFWPVRHQQTDRITFDEALLKRPSRILVRPLDEHAIRQALTVREQRWRLGALRGAFVDHCRK